MRIVMQHQSCTAAPSVLLAMRVLVPKHTSLDTHVGRHRHLSKTSSQSAQVYFNKAVAVVAVVTVKGIQLTSAMIMTTIISTIMTTRIVTMKMLSIWLAMAEHKS